MKAYPDYKDSGHGWASHIPETWKMMQLKFLTENHDGKRVPVKAEERGDMQGEYPYYGANGIIDYVNDYLFDGEYLLVGEDGSPFFLPQDVAFVASGKFWVNNHAHILKTTNGSDVRFLKYSLNTVDYREYITGSTRDKLTQSDLSRIQLPIPPLPEQQAIADFLDRKTAQIDALIEKKQRQIDLLQEQRTALINHAVTKGLPPSSDRRGAGGEARMKDSGVEWLGEIPSHWEVMKLKRVIKGNLTYGANEPSAYVDYESPRYIRITDFDDNGNLRPDTFRSLPYELAKDYFLKEGDILFARSGATVGKTFQFKNYDGLACFAGYLIKADPDESIVTSDFLYLYTKSQIYEIWKNSIFIQATIQNIGANKYQLLDVPIPPISEQLSIIDWVSRKLRKIDELILKNSGLINTFQEYRTALISEAVTGKIDVR